MTAYNLSKIFGRKTKQLALLLILGVLTICWGSVTPLHASSDTHDSGSHSSGHEVHQSSGHSTGVATHRGSDHGKGEGIHHTGGNATGGASIDYASKEFVNSPLPVIVVMIPLLAVFVIPFLGDKQGLQFCAYASLLSFVINLGMLPYIWQGKILQLVLDSSYSTISLAFFADNLSFLVGIIGSFVWMLVSFYSIEYMSHAKNLKRYNIFSMLSMAGMMGVVYTKNLYSLYIFFEMLSICSYVMVIHEETEASHKAGVKYLALGISGGLILFASFVLIHTIAGTADLVELTKAGVALGNSRWMPLIFVGMLIGFGIKAGMFPLHIWLPDAHPVAPAPASALLSGVMIKAGAYGIIRAIYNIVGLEFMRHHFVLIIVLVFACINIFLGSAMAIRAQEIKLRLAYSSIAQIGYVLLGISVLTRVGLTGGILHIFNHAMMKGTLFMCAGAFIHQTGFRQLDDLKGIGKKMPLITTCFTIAGMSMVGLPPFCGFISKWFLALGALDVAKAGSYNIWVGVFILALLITSSFMNLLYYGPVAYGAWFGKRKGEENIEEFENVDPPLVMVLPVIILASGIIIFGLFPHFPLHFAQQFSSMIFY